MRKLRLGEGEVICVKSCSKLVTQLGKTEVCMSTESTLSKGGG